MGTNSIVFSLKTNDGETHSCFRRCMSLDWTQGDLHEGLRCFHSGAFFEAHEHWESVWLAAQAPEKTFLQGLIQVAAAFHHFQRSNYAGAISLLRSALCRLDAYPEAFAGVAVAPLRATVHLWLGTLETPPRSPLPPLPQLEIGSTE
jgi:predicted metal-dependent hydrolase